MSKNPTQTHHEDNTPDDPELDNLVGFFELLLKVDRRNNPQIYERTKHYDWYRNSSNSLFEHYNDKRRPALAVKKKICRLRETYHNKNAEP